MLTAEDAGNVLLHSCAQRDSVSAQARVSGLRLALPRSWHEAVGLLPPPAAATGSREETEQTRLRRGVRIDGRRPHAVAYPPAAHPRVTCGRGWAKPRTRCNRRRTTERRRTKTNTDMSSSLTRRQRQASSSEPAGLWESTPS